MVTGVLYPGFLYTCRSTLQRKAGNIEGSYFISGLQCLILYITSSSPVMGHSVPMFDPSFKRKLTSWKSQTSVRNIRCRMATHVGSEFLDTVPSQCCVYCSILLQKKVAKLGIVVWPDQAYSSGIIVSLNVWRNSCFSSAEEVNFLQQTVCLIERDLLYNFFQDIHVPDGTVWGGF